MTEIVATNTEPGAGWATIKKTKPRKHCEHGKRKHRCKECGGASICEHGRQKPQCKECGGSAICEHGRRKTQCKECGGTAICEHGRRKARCKECGGSGICEHGIQKESCKECRGSQWLKTRCKSEHCEENGHKKYDGLCIRCCVHLRPDIKVVRNYKTKEKHVADHIIWKFPNFTWVEDKRIQDGCSQRRPDLLVDMGAHVVIVEIDENKHSSYECSCENKRVMQISQDHGHRPIVFIRFNPDGYTKTNGEKVKSCWRMNPNGTCVVASTRIREWNERLKCLEDQVTYWTNNPTDKTVETVQLYYE